MWRISASAPGIPGGGAATVPHREFRAFGCEDRMASSQTVRFPAKLPTTAEVNRGLASQEMGRRALEEKLGRLERQLGRQVKNDAAITGLVTLAIGGGLTAFGAVKAAEETTNKFNSWANQGSTQIASVVSATQLATTAAKLDDQQAAIMREVD